MGLAEARGKVFLPISAKSTRSHVADKKIESYNQHTFNTSRKVTCFSDISINRLKFVSIFLGPVT